MKKIAILFTGMGGLVGDLNGYLAQYAPSNTVINMVDDSLIKEAILNEGVTDSIYRRVERHVENAVDAGADVIISACSSMGNPTLAAKKKTSVPVVRIDEAMIRKALSIGKRIGVIASLSTTLTPTAEYIYTIAEELGIEAEVHATVATGAYEAMKRGEMEEHDRLILNTAWDVKPYADVIILAQGSMARFEQTLEEQLKIPVLSSPKLCAMAVGKMLK